MSASIDRLTAAATANTLATEALAARVAGAAPPVDATVLDAISQIVETNTARLNTLLPPVA